MAPRRSGKAGLIQPGDRIIPEMAKGDLSPNNTTKSKKNVVNVKCRAVYYPASWHLG